MNAALLPGKIEHWPLALLKPYARNAKTHDAGQVTKIAASMAEFGWTVPVLVAADGELIAGHGRILAAAQLGLTEAPVIVLDHLTEAQRRAYRIADNKLTELGGWDEALLLQELQALLAEDFDLGLVGIPEDELDALLQAGDDDRPEISDDAADAIPEPPAEPITKPGDIWALGKHRLCCGDATDAAAVAKLMQGEQATLMFTSGRIARDDAQRCELAKFGGDLGPVIDGGVVKQRAAGDDRRPAHQDNADGFGKGCIDGKEENRRGNFASVIAAMACEGVFAIDADAAQHRACGIGNARDEGDRLAAEVWVHLKLEDIAQGGGLDEFGHGSWSFA